MAIVENVPAAAADVDRFADLDEAVRDIIATCADVAPEGFDLEWCFQQE